MHSKFNDRSIQAGSSRIVFIEGLVKPSKAPLVVLKNGNFKY